MRRTLLNCCCLMAAVSFLSMGSAGCQTAETSTEAVVSPGAISLCTGCGQIKGSASCCRPGAATCPACGLAKGSPGCCTIEKGSTVPVALCTSCGQIKGSAACCRPGAAKCASCGLVKGSPGCCKLPKTDA